MKSFLNLRVLFFISLVALSCNSQQKTKQDEKSDGFSVISPQDFLEKSTNQLIVDVRTPKEFNEGHLENAVLINFFENNFIDQFKSYNKNEPIFIYCRSGKRSANTSKELALLGFKLVYDLDGGIKNWTAKNYKIVK